MNIKLIYTEGYVEVKENIETIMKRGRRLVMWEKDSVLDEYIVVNLDYLESFEILIEDE